MTARPVPRSVEPYVMYAVMTAEPLDTEDLLSPPSAELLRHYGSSDDAVTRLATRPYQRLLMSKPTLDNAAFTTRDTRVAALELAEQHDGVAIDLTIPRIVEQQSAEVSLAHSTQWYAVDYTELSSGRMTTMGLSTFGLPEVAVHGVDERNHAMFSAVLAGLTHRLIAEWPANDPVGAATVTLRDIAYGLGDADAATTPSDRAVRLDIAYEPDAGVLRVELRDDPAVALFAP